MGSVSEAVSVKIEDGWRLHQFVKFLSFYKGYYFMKSGTLSETVSLFTNNHILFITATLKYCVS